MNKRLINYLFVILTLMLFPTLTFAKDIIKPTGYFDTEAKIWVIDESGINMYSDSSETSENFIAQIPYNSVITSKAQKQVDANTWVYVKYNDLEGWILISEGSASRNVALQYEKSGLNVASTINLYEKPQDNSKVISKVSSGSILTAQYSYGMWQLWFYVEYNGVKGWIKGQESFVKEETKKVVLLNDTYVYEEPDGKKTATKVSKNRILTLTAIKDTIIDNKTITYGLYELNGKSVWILISGDNVNYASEISPDMLENEIYVIESGDKIYSSANSKSKEVGVIDENTKITEAYKYKDAQSNDIYYISSSSGNGWILKEFYSYQEDEIKNDPINNDKTTIKNTNNIIWIISSIICIIVIIGIIFIVKKNKKTQKNK